jgi:type II secretory pathway pseudopilin PulG
MVEVLLVIGLLATTATATLPPAHQAVTTARGRQAAGYLATQLRSAQLHAVRSNRAAGLVFDAVQGHWQFRMCVDGNGNGLRRTEVGSIDVCLYGPIDMRQQFPEVSIAVDPALQGPDGEAGSSDPVRFGAADIASFSPAGTGSSGSIFLRLADGQHFLVRVTGVTGRTRTLRHHPHPGTWELL